MAQLTIGSSTPSDGALDVFVNNAIDVTFDSAVLESSVSSTSVVLTNQATDGVVPATVELSSATVIRITPYGNLAEDTVYRVRFPGTDTALGPDYVIKDVAASEALTTTLTVTFTTGSRVYLDQISVDKDAVDLSLEGDLSLPVHVKALGSFAISGTVPKNHEADIAVDSPLRINFNQPLHSGSFNQDWLDVDVFPILDDTNYLGSPTSDEYGGTIPDYSVSHDYASLWVNFSGDLPKNVGVHVEIDQNVIARDGSEFGPNDYLLSFTTERYPDISGVHVLRREIKAAAETLYDDYIASVILSKSIEADARFGTGAVPHLSLIKWVVNSAIVDILDDVELEKAIQAGVRRQLGDMNVSVDPIIGKLAIKHARAQKKIEEAEKSLIGRGAVAQAYSTENKRGIRRSNRSWFGVSNKVTNARFITYQGNHPGANTSRNRQAKVQPDNLWWGNGLIQEVLHNRVNLYRRAAMRNSIALLVLLSLSCSPEITESSLPEEAEKEVFSFWEYELTPFEMFTFYLVVDNGALGVGFIADNRMWTANHLYENTGPDWINQDLKCLGSSPVKGLAICKEDHKIGDSVFYRSKNGPSFGEIARDDSKYFIAAFQKKIKQGHSGSPMICYEHTNVVGVLSGFYTNYQNIGFFVKIPNNYEKLFPNRDKLSPKESAQPKEEVLKD